MTAILDFISKIPAAVWAAFIAAIVALLTNAIISPWTATIARRSEERRWYLDHFLPLRVTSLHEFYSALISVQTALDRFQHLAATAHESPNEPAYRKIFDEHHEAFAQEVGVSYGPHDVALAKAWIFLDQQARDVMDALDTEVLTIRLQIDFALRGETPPADADLPKNIDWKKYLQTFKRAQVEIERLLNPTELLAQSRKPL